MSPDSSNNPPFPLSLLAPQGSASDEVRFLSPPIFYVTSGFLRKLCFFLKTSVNSTVAPTPNANAADTAAAAFIMSPLPSIIFSLIG